MKINLGIWAGILNDVLSILLTWLLTVLVLKYKYQESKIKIKVIKNFGLSFTPNTLCPAQCTLRNERRSKELVIFWSYVECKCNFTQLSLKQLMQANVVHALETLIISDTK